MSKVWASALWTKWSGPTHICKWVRYFGPASNFGLRLWRLLKMNLGQGFKVCGPSKMWASIIGCGPTLQWSSLSDWYFHRSKPSNFFYYLLPALWAPCWVYPKLCFVEDLHRRGRKKRRHILVGWGWYQVILTRLLKIAKSELHWFTFMVWSMNQVDHLKRTCLYRYM